MFSNTFSKSTLFSPSAAIGANLGAFQIYLISENFVAPFTFGNAKFYSLQLAINLVFKDEKILVINSEYLAFFPIAVLLRKQNFILTYCKSFEEAYDILKDKYDLVIIDEDNSDLDIFDFLDYCKEIELKKIVISSENIEEKDYVKKQFIKNELMNKILIYLGR